MYIQCFFFHSLTLFLLFHFPYNSKVLYVLALQHVPANILRDRSLTFPEKITLSRCRCFQSEVYFSVVTYHFDDYVCVIVCPENSVLFFGSGHSKKGITKQSLWLLTTDTNVFESNKSV